MNRSTREPPMLKKINTSTFKRSPLDVDPATILAVIPALNEARHIETCIRSLLQGSPILQLIPLVVADGGSTDETVAIVKRLTAEFPNLRLILNPKRLQSAAINLAVATQSNPGTRWLIRCDAHSNYHQNFILHVVEALQRTGAASVVIPMDAVGETCFERANAWVVDTLLGSGGSLHRGGGKSSYVDHGHHAGFDIAWFRSTGGYDESFSHNEDAEYDHRVTQAGGKIWLDADIRIEYTPRSSVRSLARQYFNYGKGRAKNARKHNRRLKLRQAAPLFVLAACVLGVVGGLFQWQAFLLPAGYLSVLIGASISLTMRHKSACGLLSGIAAGTMHLAWATGFAWESVTGKR